RTYAHKVFAVAEYVLPKFEVSVILPSYVLTTETDVTATIKAKYTYGKPVKGTVNVTFSFLPFLPPTSDYIEVKKYSGNVRKAVKGAVTGHLIDGETKVTLPFSKAKSMHSNLNKHRLVVTANVTEDVTNNVISAKAMATMCDSEVNLEFPDINPKNFKPGLKYTALLKISQPDGLPVNPSSEQIIVSTEVVIPDQYVKKFWARYWTTKKKSLPDKLFSVPNNGMVTIPVMIEEPEAVEVKITAKLSGVTRNLKLIKSRSPSSSYIQLELKTASKIQAGDNIDLEVTSTRPLTQLTYQVLSRGSIVKTGTVASKNKTVQAFSLTTDASMAPKARILVYYVRQDGEIVADSIILSVDGAFLNKVSVKVSNESAEPGDPVTITVNADPSSVAHLAAIDQSVLLLKSGNDVTADDVWEELEDYDTISPQKKFELRRWNLPVYNGGSDAKKTLHNSGVTVLTDCFVYQYIMRPHRWHSMKIADDVPYETYFVRRDRSASALAEPLRLRENFVESWLWNEITLGANGTATTTATIPDTITSWVVSAFATNQVSGFGIAPTQAKLTVFKPFFVSLNLPYSVTRGEQLALQANVFNYLQQNVTVRVTLAMSADFVNIFIDDNGLETYSQEEVFQDVMVVAGDAKSVYFPIIPSQVGRISLEVKAQTTIAADAVRRQLLVEAEGVPKEYNVPVLIDLAEGRTSFTKTVNLTLPVTTVAGSELVRVSAVGDLMGPTIAGLDSLLSMPTGCGEQTMLGLAPDVYVTDYLKSVHQLTPDIESKALGFMENGYQRELTFKHKDGSFSAFGHRDSSGSMWLTAFVTRVFHQAKSHIFVDTDIIRRAISWMIRQQAADGSFPEPGKVLDKKMQGQAASGVGLTCFVYISLLENQDLFAFSQWTVKPAMLKALAFLKTEVARSTDPYILAMASYAFQLAGSPQAQPVLDRLETMAVKEGAMRYWHKTEAPKAKQGFTSTQDTVVALNALSQFTKMTTGNNYNIHITTLLDSVPTYTFDITDANFLLLQTQETKTMPSEVKIDATGNGTALVEVSVFFNVESEVEDLTFDLSVTVMEETLSLLVVETCTRWLGQEDSSSMAVQEIGVPSGFSVSPEAITQLDILKRIEVQNKKVVLYFDQFNALELLIKPRIRLLRLGPTSTQLSSTYDQT
ncbi:hypothetical protein RRG08_012456, partial [Elysia crispata]